MTTKHKKTNSPASEQPEAGDSDPGTAAVTCSLNTSGRRLWLMRLTAATLVPLLILGTLEIGLRIAGYGYDTSYFLPATVDGEDYLIPNPKFSHRFFPPALARSPLPMRILARKPANTFRIFLFGESAAYGDPDPAYGVGRYLEKLLMERYPGASFEVVCVAMVAINSHAILPIAQQCAKLEGDLWIVYMGNNEMIGAFGPGTVFSTKAPGLRMVRLILALKKLRMVQLLDNFITGLRPNSEAPESWGGIDMFSKNLLRHDDAGRSSAYQNFKGNLEDILSVGEEAGVPIILSTVAGKLKDCSPFASLHAAGLEAMRLSEWEKFQAEGIALEKQGLLDGALNAYSNAAAIDPEFAELPFRMANCHLALTNTEAALQAFERARDYDTLGVRADSRINQILVDTAKTYPVERVVLVDAPKALAAISHDGIPGKELFFEHVHYTLEGNYQLARIFADVVTGFLPASITAKSAGNWADIELCNRLLAVTAWDEHRLWQGIINRTATAPFTSQSSHGSNTRYYEDRRLEVISRMTSQTPVLDRQLYEQALATSPDDCVLRSHFAQYLEATGARQEAIAQCQRVCELLPSLEWPHYHQGDLLARAGRYSEAAECFRRALAIRNDFSLARKELRRVEGLLVK